MSGKNPQECTKPVVTKAKLGPEKTSDYYRVSEQLPDRFNNPGCFRGYRTDKIPSMYQTSNQTYGSRAPTVHEMPKVYYPHTSEFSRQFLTSGMFRRNNINVSLEKSIVTGPDNYITHCDRLNFHPSYNVNRPSICD
ncbi:piercer of microtubule wall 1 protein [Meriones unguiculatus]|uniref:piercer of microtubule wall 1 protein n=1 Tax=Meriones unguiculatus TaxID=10047 RepID=UPI000B4FD3CA|nr:piercer of microtubule wall 1 protein [Meriones unguiculatus]